MKYLITLVLICCAFSHSNATTFTVRDLGIDRNTITFARSLNQSGNVAGQYSTLTETADFYWNSKSGLHVITTKGHNLNLPVINNRDQVAGVTENQLYLFEPDKGMVLLGRPKGWEAIIVCGFTDQGQILVGNWKKQLTAIKQYALWAHDRFVNIDLPGFPMAFNASGDLLVWNAKDHTTAIYNIATKEKTVFDVEFFGLAINDKRHVVGFNRKSNQSYFWTPETGMTALTIPAPNKLNNLDQMIGYYDTGSAKLGLWIGEQIIDLNQAVDSVNSPVKDLKSIINLIAINDDGQILAHAKTGGFIQIVLLEPQESAEKDYKQQAQEEWNQMSPEMQQYYEYEIDRISEGLNKTSS